MTSLNNYEDDEPPDDVSTEEEQRLEADLAHMLQRLDPNCSSRIRVRVYSEDERLLAEALGGRLFSVAVGTVSLHGRLVDELNPAELRFVLGHELTHIYANHLLARLPKPLMRELAEESPFLGAVSVALDVFDLVRHLGYGDSLQGGITRDQEVEADLCAIWVTGNKSACFSALQRLSGGNLDQASHMWEALGVELPAMTLRERLGLVQARVAQLERLGHRFE